MLIPWLLIIGGFLGAIRVLRRGATYRYENENTGQVTAGSFGTFGRVVFLVLNLAAILAGIAALTHKHH